MPCYLYRSVDDPTREFEFFHKVGDPRLTNHPETNEPIRRAITSIAYKEKIKINKGRKVDKSSPAATRCGCASNYLRNHHVTKKTCC